MSRILPLWGAILLACSQGPTPYPNYYRGECPYPNPYIDAEEPPPTPGIRSNPSALQGPYSTLNSWESAVGQGFDLIVPGQSRLMWITFEHDDNWPGPTGEDLLSFQSSNANGYLVNLASGVGALVRRVPGTISGTFSPDIYTGSHTLVIGSTPAGLLRYSFDGNTAAQLSSNTSYVSPGGSGKLCIGYNLNEGGGVRPATASKIISFGFIIGPWTDADLESIASNTGTATRWDFPPAALAFSGIYSAHHAKDWDGVSNTWVASLGSNPITLNIRGTGGGRTVLAGMERHILLENNWIDNSLYLPNETSPVPHIAMGTFSWQEYSHSANRSWLEVLCSLSPVLADNWNVGLDVNGSQVQTRRNHVGGGISVFPGNIMTIRDIPNQTAVSNTYKITAGIQSKSSSSPLLGVFPQAIWLPIGITPVFSVKPRPRKRILILGNSLPEQVAGPSANISTPAVQAWSMIARANAVSSNCRITTKVYGSRQYSHNIETAPERQVLAQEIISGCDGTEENTAYLELSTNDWGLNGGYTDEALFIIDLLATIDAIYAEAAAQSIPGFILILQTPTHRANDTTLNASGTGMALIAASNSFSNAMAVIAASRPLVILVDGGPMITYPTGYSSDLLHFLPSGHVEFESNFRLLPGIDNYN